MGRRNYFKLIQSGFLNIKQEGIRDTLKKTKSVLNARSILNFSQWAKHPLFSEKELQLQREKHFDRDIKISVAVPLYNTEPEVLKEMIESVKAQTYGKWELCLADGSDSEHSYVEEICKTYFQEDTRIRYQKLSENLGIIGNSNRALDMTNGDFISLLDHDDLLHPAALHEVMVAICEKDADFVYTDELTFLHPNRSKVTFINFKPDYSLDLLRSVNYICHLTTFSRALFNMVGGFREGFEGSQDHDLILRLTDVAQRIVHIPEALYYWRATPNSTAMDMNAKPYCAVSGRKAVLENIHAHNMEGTVRSVENFPVMYRVDYRLPEKLPLISIVIPTCDHVDDLEHCIRSVKEKTTYSNYELFLVENNSCNPATFTYYSKLQERYPDIQIITWEGKGFNWSAINNFAVREACHGEYILLLNNDVQVITPDWLEQMMMFAQRPDTGIVGARLLFPNETIQHAGVIVGIGGVAGHVFNGMSRSNPGYMCRAIIAQNLSAVTGACLMIRRSVFDEVGGIEEELAVSFNDIDLCMKVRKAGYLVTYTPYAELYHFESKSRGIANTKEKKAQQQKEIDFFKNRWRDFLIQGDPYYNANLTLRRNDFTLVAKQGCMKKEYDYTNRTEK